MLAAVPALAEELSFMGGMVGNMDSHEQANAYQIEYLKPIKGAVALGASYLNQGHFVNHHRDGFILQLWWKQPFINPDISLKAGLGPYLYFDTNERLSGPHFKNEHGLGVVYSIGAEWQFRKSLSIQIRSNWILTSSNIDTLSLLFGIGLELDRTPENEAVREYGNFKENKNEFTPLLGYMASNNNDQNGAKAWGLEFRRRIADHIEWTASWLDEGNNDLFHRRGIAAQIWAVDSFYGDRLTFGIGVGPYLAWNAYPDRLIDKEGEILAGLFAITAEYRFNTIWGIRASWYRVMTDYDRDTDIFFAGPVFRF